MKSRESIYNMFGGKCAYCGCDITMKTMQVDHIEPKAFGGGNDDHNLFPACASCNKYKSAFSLEAFRIELKKVVSRQIKKPMIRLAMRYGMMIPLEWDGVFYFEKKGRIK